MNSFKQRLLTLVDWFVSDKIHCSENIEQILRARILVSVLMLNILLMLGVFIFGELFGEYSRYSVYIGTTVISAILVLFVLCLNIFKYTASFSLAGNLYGLAAYGGLIVAALLTGGYYESPFMVLLLALPICVYIFTDLRYSLIWLAIITCTLAAFYCALLQGVKFHQTLLPGHLRLFYLLSILALGLLSVASLYCFDKLNHYLVAKLNSAEHSTELQPLPAQQLLDIFSFITNIKNSLDYSILNNTKSVIAIVNFSAVIDEYLKQTPGSTVHDLFQEVVKHCKREINCLDSAAQYERQSIAFLLKQITQQDSINSLLNQLEDLINQTLIKHNDTIENAIIPNAVTLNTVTLNTVILNTVKMGAVIAPDHGDDIITLLYKAQESLQLAKTSKENICLHEE